MRCIVRVLVLTFVMVIGLVSSLNTQVDTLLAYQTIDSLVVDSVKKKKPPMRRGEISPLYAFGQSDFYRSTDDRFGPLGGVRKSAWMAGLSLRGGKRWYEARVDLFYAQQGGVELINSLTDGEVMSEVDLTYLGFRAQPLNIRIQTGKFYVHAGGGGYLSVLLSDQVTINNRLFESGPQTYEFNPYDFGFLLSAGIGFGPINVIGSFQTGQQAIDMQNEEIKNHLITLGFNIWL